MCGCVHGNVLGVSFFSGCLEWRGVSKVVDLLFYCACLVGCVLLFVKWLFGLCFIHVVCVLYVVVVDVFWEGIVCIYNNKV